MLSTLCSEYYHGGKQTEGIKRIFSSKVCESVLLSLLQGDIQTMRLPPDCDGCHLEVMAEKLGFIAYDAGSFISCCQGGDCSQLPLK